MVKTDTKFNFTFSELTKTQRKDKPPMSVEFSLFPNNYVNQQVKNNNYFLKSKYFSAMPSSVLRMAQTKSFYIFQKKLLLPGEEWVLEYNNC